MLGLSLGQSAVYSVISLVAKLTAGKPLAQQTATLNASVHVSTITRLRGRPRRNLLNIDV